MRILTISNVPLRKDNSLGNTFASIFDGIEDVEIASIYCRYEKPDIDFVKRSFQITEKSLLRNLINKKYPSGVEVFPDKDESVDISEPKVVDFVKKNRWILLLWSRNILWKIARWKSKELLDFIDDFKPDIIFHNMSPTEHINKMLLFLKEYTGAPLYSYMTDDNYSLNHFSLSPLFWIDRFYKRRTVKKVVENSELLYCISNVQKEYCESKFSVPCKLLTKSADFSKEPNEKKQYGNLLELVYTGNITLNRWKSLAVIASALEEINKNGIKAQLKIYTGSPITKKMRKALDVEGSSYLMGFVQSSEVFSIQNNADILVHVEAFDLKNKLIVKQSFSTKIVDYLKMARPIIAVGPKEVASIDHLIRNDCAIVADNKDELVKRLNEVINDNNKLTEIALKGYDCGKKHHNKTDYNKMLSEDLRSKL